MKYLSILLVYYIVQYGSWWKDIILLIIDQSMSKSHRRIYLLLQNLNIEAVKVEKGARLIDVCAGMAWIMINTSFMIFMSVLNIKQYSLYALL